MNYTILPFSSSSDELVQCYINVFGEAPRNEWYISELTWALYPLSTTEFSGDVVRPYYDPQDLSRQWNERSSQQWFVWQLAQTLDDTWSARTVWFIAWRKTNLQQLNNEKLWLADVELLRQATIDQFPDFDDQNLFYAADLGVMSDYRNQWLARQLYDARQNALIEQWMKWVIVRTIKWLTQPYQWYIDRCGFTPVYDYNDQQNRTILVSKL